MIFVCFLFEVEFVSHRQFIGLAFGDEIYPIPFISFFELVLRVFIMTLSYSF